MLYFNIMNNDRTVGERHRMYYYVSTGPVEEVRTRAHPFSEHSNRDSNRLYIGTPGR